MHNGGLSEAMPTDRDIDPGEWFRWVARWVSDAMEGARNGYTPRVQMRGNAFRVNYAGACAKPFEAFWRCRAGTGLALTRVRDMEWKEEEFCSDLTIGQWEAYTRTRYLDEPLEVGGCAYLSFPCRRCGACQRVKTKMWVKRSLVEMERHQRTWFVTLTFADSWFRKTQLLDEDPRKAARREAQLFYKRVRKAGIALRHMTVLEEGEQTGRLHLHALVHSSVKLQRRHLRSCWTAGAVRRPSIVESSSAFQKHRAAEYVSKYMTKCIGERIMSSLRYGQKTPSKDSASVENQTTNNKYIMGSGVLPQIAEGDSLADGKAKDDLGMGGGPLGGG